MAQKMVDEGGMNEEDTSRWNHMLWNVIGGGSDEMDPEVYKAQLKDEDVLLFCTDGLTKHVADEDLTNLFQKGLSSRECAERLIKMANQAGGSDNITVIVACL